MLKFREIAVTTDFSDRSLRALPYAVGLAELFNARLRVVYAYEPVPRVTDVAWTGTSLDALEKNDRDKAQTALENIVSEQVPESIRAEAVVLDGKPVHAIIQYAENENIDLIVMSTAGRTGLTHVLLGSTAEALVRKAPCPVLTVKQPLRIGGGDFVARNE